MRQLAIIVPSVGTALSFWFLWSCRHPSREVMRRIARNMMTLGMCKRTLTSFVRLIIPMTIYIITCLSLVFIYGFDTRSLPVLLGALATLFASIINIFVVKHTGRPSCQIPRVFRGKSEEELRRWFSEPERVE